MCKCTPTMRTPFCGAPGCEWPRQKVADCKHMDFQVNAKISRLEDSGGFMAELRASCTQCGTPFQWLGLEPGCDLQGARVSIDGLEANIAICPVGAKPSPLQRMVFNIKRFDG
jgi:hypothetical protein